MGELLLKKREKKRNIYIYIASDVTHQLNTELSIFFTII